MDHSLYGYSPLPARPQAPVTPGTHLTAFAVLFLEHWDAVPPPDAVRDPRFVGEFGSFSPDYRSWTQREYGLRLGVFRVVDALREAGIRPAVAANARAVQRLPRLVKSFNDWGCEWVAHGWSASALMHSRMSLAQQQEHIESSIATLTECTGQRPLGWLSQDWGSTPETYALLARSGMRYTLDWVNDDQPYWMRTEPGLLAIPLSAEWDDVQCQWLRHIEPRAHAALTLSAFERLRAEGARQPRGAVFGLSIHPWVSGMPSRIAALRSLLAGLRAHADVAWTLPGDIFQTMTRR